MDTFVEDLSHCLVDLSHDKKTYYILGDLNIDTSSSNQLRWPSGVERLSLEL